MQANSRSHDHHHDLRSKRVKPTLSIAPDPAPSHEPAEVAQPSAERRVDPLLMITAAAAIVCVLLVAAASLT